MIILSPISIVVELTEVVVPLTNKSPWIVTFEPVNSIAVFNDDEYVSNALILPVCVLSVVAIEALTEFKSLAALALNDVYSALLALIVVATDELNVPPTLATEALNSIIW